MAIITRGRKLFTVIYDYEGKKNYETYYDYQIALKRKKALETGNYELKIDKDTPFIEYLYLLLNIHGRKDLSFSTYDSYTGIINNYLKDYFTDKVISDIDDSLIEQFFKQLKKTSAKGSNTYKDKYISFNVCRKIKNLLSYSCNYLVQFNFLSVNPVNNIQLTAKVKTINIDDTFDINDTITLFKNCDDSRLYIVLILVYFTNLRINELLCLTINDIFIEDKLLANDACFIKINKLINRLSITNLQTIDPKLIIDKEDNHGSTHSNTQLTVYKIPEREEPISIELALLLKQYIDEKKENDSNYIICRQDRKIMDSRYLGKSLKILTNSLNLPSVSFNKLKKQSHSQFDEKNSNREYLFNLIKEEIRKPVTTAKAISSHQKMNIQTSKKLKKVLPTKEDEITNNFIKILKEDDELKIELINRLKELL